MKIMIKKLECRFISAINIQLVALTLFGFLLCNVVVAQTHTRVIDKSFDARAKLTFNHQRGPLTIKRSTNGKVRFASEIRVETPNKAEAEALFDKIESDLDVSEFGDELKIALGLDRRKIKTWNQTNNDLTIKFRDGTRIKGLTNFKIQTILYVPETKGLRLSANFDDVIIESDVVLNDLSAKLHSANLEAGIVNGNLNLAMSFGRTVLEKVGGDAEINLHDSKIKMGNAKDVVLDVRFSEIDIGAISALEAKSHEGRIHIKSIKGKATINGRFTDYVIAGASDISVTSHEGNFEIASAKDVVLDTRFTDYRIGNVASFRATSHEGQIEVGDVVGNVDLRSKFTDYRFKKIGNLDINSHEGNLEIKEGKEFIANTRFTDFRFGSIESLEVTDAHEGSYTIETIGKLKAKVAFTDFSIEELKESFELSAHEGDTQIGTVGMGLKKIDLSGRFYEVEVGIPSNVAYHLYAEMNYGNLSFPSGLEVVKQIEKDSRREYEMKTKNANQNSAVIRAEGHEGKVRIR
ncbi:MAG: hypothetical protein AAF806_16175 [Bacteroidota bacterium]